MQISHDAGRPFDNLAPPLRKIRRNFGVGVIYSKINTLNSLKHTLSWPCKKNVNLKTYEETISMPKSTEKQDDYNISQDDITIQRLLDDDENPNCQQVRRKKRKYNEISKPPQNIPSINSQVMR
ncbi:hypothetical protein L9F63_017564, partial [Diploptera punctata]